MRRLLWELDARRREQARARGRAADPAPHLDQHEAWLLEQFWTLDGSRPSQMVAAGRYLYRAWGPIPLRDIVDLGVALEMPTTLRPAFLAIMRRVDHAYMEHVDDEAFSAIRSANTAPSGSGGMGERR